MDLKSESKNILLLRDSKSRTRRAFVSGFWSGVVELAFGEIKPESFELVSPCFTE